jgi:hypothetical protein
MMPKPHRIKPFHHESAKKKPPGRRRAGDLFVNSSISNPVLKYNGTTGVFVKNFTSGGLARFSARIVIGVALGEVSGTRVASLPDR